MHGPNHELPTLQQKMTTGLNSPARYDVGPSKGRSNAASAPGVAEAEPRREGAPGTGGVRAADEATLHRVARRRARQKVQRKERVDVRYSTDEKTEILAAARRLGLAGAHLVGALVMAHLNGDLALPGQRTATDDLIDEYAALRTQLSRIGTNANQIAHRLNAGGDTHPVDTAVLAEARQLVAAVEQTVTAVDTVADVAATTPRAA
ncbi:MobC family plasmid mobilization relaxosome protein [Streptomyces sp. SCSIO 30461]|uniref:MobC family plasmid mobilization relaxosome protein n=1 Tax=Streptomyces sp. SCSIO 30461 TaxID=3118085 RepID=UPI0030CAF7DB